MADPDRLQWILACLLSNACLASPDGGRVEVQVAHSSWKDLPSGREHFIEGGDGFVSVCVKDTGRGLSDKALGEVFAPTRPGQSPPGLGESGATLARVKALIEAHGGWLLVESQEGVGTAFSFSLPLGGGSDRSLAGRSLEERDVVAVG